MPGGDIAVRILTRDEAIAHADRLRAIFRDAVKVAGPAHYTPDQVTVWASTADEPDRWAPWLAEGATWIAESPAAGPVGFVMVHPEDYVHLLYIDPAFHRRGVGRALLAAVEPASRAAGVEVLTADASLIAHPVFLAQGYEVVAWEEVVRKDVMFARARMRKSLHDEVRTWEVRA
jgi:putative acetyltransferase